jgi:GAF domain-containing protein
MLPGLDLPRFDALVVVFGGIEAVTFGSVAACRAGLESFLEAVESLVPTLQVFVVSVPFASSMVDMPWLYRRLTDAHTKQINRATQQLCAERPRATYIPFEPPKSRVVEDIGRQHYERWAALIVGPIASGLNDHVMSPPFVTDELKRLASLERLGIHEGDVNRELQQLVEAARSILGTSGAELNIIDRTRQWALANSGTRGRAIPRNQSICTTTITSHGAVVIEDTHLVEPYRNLPLTHGDDPVRFYAGHPIEAPDGHRIGALCVVDNKPRTFSWNDQRILRELATTAQTLLWQKYAGASH